MEKILIVKGNRSAYCVNDVKNYTLTIGELIDKLKYFDKDTKIIIGNDLQRYGFYTYGELDTIYQVEVNKDGEYEKDDLEEV